MGISPAAPDGQKTQEDNLLAGTLRFSEITALNI